MRRYTSKQRIKLEARDLHCYHLLKIQLQVFKLIERKITEPFILYRYNFVILQLVT